MRVTVPSAGTRFTCTSSTERKMPTRQRGTVPRPSSAGGDAGPTDTTRPSAGARRALGRPGATRSGSRKKYRQNSVKMTPSQDSHAPTARPSAMPTMPMRMNGRPAGCGGASTMRSVSVIAIGSSRRPVSWMRGWAVGRHRQQLPRIDLRRVADLARIGLIDHRIAHALAVIVAGQAPQAFTGVHEHAVGAELVGGKLLALERQLEARSDLAGRAELIQTKP